MAASPANADPRHERRPSLFEEISEWLGARFRLINGWMRERPVEATLLGLLLGAIIFYFGGLKLFSGYTRTTFLWAWEAWNPETNYEHGVLIPWIALVLFLHALPSLKGLTVSSSRWGLAWIVGGVLLYLLAARTLQPRIALVAVPCVIFGAILYTWGRDIAKPLFFPSMFLLFAVPLNFVEQASFRLQFVVTALASALCNFIGIRIVPFGTTMRSADDAFQFEIAGGCSGINSLMAITMLTAIFVHFTQDRLWKKLVLFSSSVVFAIIGNVMRITVIMAVAKFYDAKFAGGKFHDISAYVVSFPFAFISMFYASKLVNLKPAAVLAQVEEGLRPEASKERPVSTRYDY